MHVSAERFLKMAMVVAFGLSGCSSTPEPVVTQKQPVLASVCSGTLVPTNPSGSGNLRQVDIEIALTPSERVRFHDNIWDNNGTTTELSVKFKPSCHGRYFKLSTQAGQLTYHIKVVEIANDGKPRAFTWEDHFPIAAGGASGVRDGMSYQIVLTPVQ